MAASSAAVLLLNHLAAIYCFLLPPEAWLRC